MEGINNRRASTVLTSVVKEIRSSRCPSLTAKTKSPYMVSIEDNSGNTLGFIKWTGTSFEFAFSLSNCDVTYAWRPLAEISRILEDYHVDMDNIQENELLEISKE